jgi:WD40 repeat protein
MSYDQTGIYIAIGDQSGRIIIFNIFEVDEKVDLKSTKIEYRYLFEFQSFTREFDFLKGRDIDEKVKNLTWLRHQGDSMYILTCNDKITKFWKISQKQDKQAKIPDLAHKKYLRRKTKITSAKSRDPGREVYGSDDLLLPEIKNQAQGLHPTLKQSYPNLHNYSINSVTVSPNNQNFLTSDDLRYLSL